MRVDELGTNDFTETNNLRIAGDKERFVDQLVGEMFDEMVVQFPTPFGPAKIDNGV